MDFGSLVCTKRNPKWEMCPLTKQGICRAAVETRRGRVSGKDQETCQRHVSTARREPGRFVGTTYIPNRIFRGKIVEELRDVRKGLPLAELGRRVCLDWKPSEHRKWLKGILLK